jgi:hypothetical protein
MKNLYLCILFSVFSVSFCSAQFGITKPFGLLSPANNATVVLQGDRNTTMQFSWNSGTTSIATSSTYKWLMDTIGSDFVSPAVLVCACNTVPTFDTVFTVTLDALANYGASVKTFNIGDTIDIEWSVSLSANDAQPLYENRDATQPFRIRLIRGVFDDELKLFGLNTPVHAANINIGGSVGQLLGFGWASTDCPSGCAAPSYYIMLDSLNGNFDNPVIFRLSNNSGIDTFYNLPYIEIAGILDAAGVKTGSSKQYKWTVRAENSNSSVNAKPFHLITFTRGRFDNEHRPFEQLTPANYSIIKIEKDTAKTVDFAWNSTDLPANNDVRYTLQFDTSGGTFTNLHPLTPADTFFNDTTYSIKNYDLREKLDSIYGNAWNTVKLDWRVRADIGGSWFYSATTYNVTFARGYFTGFAEIKNSIVNHTVFPNPSHENALLEYELTSNQHTEISITDITGKVVLHAAQENKAGIHRYLINISSLKSGTYFYSLSTAAGFVSGKFVVSR